VLPFLYGPHVLIVVAQPFAYVAGHEDLISSQVTDFFILLLFSLSSLFFVLIFHKKLHLSIGHFSSII
jgi:hypothetical protein